MFQPARKLSVQPNENKHDVDRTSPSTHGPRNGDIATGRKMFDTCALRFRFPLRPFVLCEIDPCFRSTPVSSLPCLASQRSTAGHKPNPQLHRLRVCSNLLLINSTARDCNAGHYLHAASYYGCMTTPSDLFRAFCNGSLKGLDTIW